MTRLSQSSATHQTPMQCKALSLHPSPPFLHSRHLLALPHHHRSSSSPCPLWDCGDNTGDDPPKSNPVQIRHAYIHRRKRKKKERKIYSFLLPPLWRSPGKQNPWTETFSVFSLLSKWRVYPKKKPIILVRGLQEEKFLKSRALPSYILHRSGGSLPLFFCRGHTKMRGWKDCNTCFGKQGNRITPGLLLQSLVILSSDCDAMRLLFIRLMFRVRLGRNVRVDVWGLSWKVLQRNLLCLLVRFEILIEVKHREDGKIK